MPKPRTLHDEFFKRAKADGYVARSVYKLEEIQEKRRLLRATDRVVDLGCAPGSWLQLLAKNLDPERGGRAVGIDLTPINIPLPDHVQTLVGDIYKTEPAVLLRAAGFTDREIRKDARFDVILSDMAPNTSGHGDDFLSARLCDRVLDLCPTLLRPGGNLIMKILEGEPTPDVIKRAKSLFGEAGTTKPAASRDVSKEIFIWGKGYGQRPKTKDTRPASRDDRPARGPRRAR
ncbi:MAG TPA: RlmE family RNA methyltransferase [Phycisphaerales bacterium]|nr:RlmE family RNA methyltransferase [Phycisphaerales bacterium]